MKCNQIFAYLESNNPIKKMIARRHAIRCLECQKACSTFSNIKQVLSDTEPLTSKQHELWMNVVDPTTIEKMNTEKRGKVKLAASFFMAACLLFLLFFTQKNLQNKTDNNDLVKNRNEVESVNEIFRIDKPSAVGTVQISEITEVTFNTDFSDLKQDILELEREIKTQKIHAQLLDARKQIEILLAANQD